MNEPLIFSLALQHERKTLKQFSSARCAKTFRSLGQGVGRSPNFLRGLMVLR